MRLRPLAALAGLLAVFVAVWILTGREPGSEVGSGRPAAVGGSAVEPPAPTAAERRSAVADVLAADGGDVDSAAAVLPVDVVDEGGAPVAGAVVTLLERDARHDYSPTSVMATSDARGRAVLRPDGPVDFAAVVVDHLDFALEFEHCAWTSGEEAPVVALGRSVTFRGRVVEFETGRPVPGARLVVLPLWDTEDILPGSPFERVTDDVGRFHTDRASDLGVSVFVYRKGWTFFHTILEPWEFVGVDYELAVPRGTTISGRVVDAVTGRPVAGARIGPDTGVVTGADGRFEVGGHDYDGGAVFVLHEGTAATTVWGGAPGTHGRADLEVPLFRAGTVDGRVVDADGRPVAGAEVRLRSLTPRDAAADPIERAFPVFEWDRLRVSTSTVDWSVGCDGDGRFRLEGLTPCSFPWRLTARLDEDPRVFTAPPVSFERPGETVEVTLRPHTVGIVRGTVTPVCDRWSVSLERGGVKVDAAAIDDDGAFTFESVLTGPARLVLMQGIEDVVEAKDVVVRDGAAVTHDFVVDRGPRRVLAGVVRRPDGRPVAGVEVAAWEPVGMRHEVETGADGRFRFEVHAAAGRKVHLRCEPEDGIERSLEVLPDDGEVELVFPETRVASFRVVDDDTGRPVPAYSIEWRWSDPRSDEPLEGGGWFEAAWQTDPELALRLPAQPVTLTVDASSLGYAPLELERFVAPADETAPPTELRLRRAE